MPFAPNTECFVKPGAERDFFNDCWSDNSTKFSMVGKSQGELRSLLFSGKGTPGHGIDRLGVRRGKVTGSVPSVIGYLLERK